MSSRRLTGQERAERGRHDREPPQHAAEQLLTWDGWSAGAFAGRARATVRAYLWRESARQPVRRLAIASVAMRKLAALPWTRSEC
jgi:hypothetical protein